MVYERVYGEEKSIGGVDKHLVKNKLICYNLLYCAYLLTALFASVSACLDNSPGNTNLHAACTALASIVDFLLSVGCFLLVSRKLSETKCRADIPCAKNYKRHCSI